MSEILTQPQTASSSLTGGSTIANSPVQAVESAIVCTHCGADVLKSGFVEMRTTYQPYTRRGDVLRKSHIRSEVSLHLCALCRTPLGASLDQLTQ